MSDQGYFQTGTTQASADSEGGETPRPSTVALSSSTVGRSSSTSDTTWDAGPALVPDGLEPPGTGTGTTFPGAERNTAFASPPAPAALFPSEHWADFPLPAPRDTDDDNDSGFGGDASERMSLAESILQYRTINGRTYHSERGDAQYWVSNDEQSNEALDINHHVLTLLKSGKLYRSPLSPDIKKAVDIGTGTGIWAIDFADEFPGAEVVGTDLSPIQPHWVPPNLQFQIDDCTRPWSFEPNSLDFVHIRLLVGSIADWPALFAQAFRALRPGGWVESHEASPVIRSDDGTLTPGGAMHQWGPLFLEGGQRTGRTFAVLEDNLQRKGMEAAGFVDLHEASYKLPVGPWARGAVHREAGRFFQAAVLQDVEGTLTFIASVLGWSEREIAGFGAHYRSEVNDPSVHAYFSQRTVWAMKPGGGGCQGG